MSIQGASSTHWKYDVFLSFRGEDTRKNFVDHLHDALKRKGINVFKDDKGLEKGKSIAPELSKAIEESRISLIVLSRNYAFSTWCLDELVQILQRKNKNKQVVFPIFYDVDPSMVRNQTKIFQDAFAEHDRKNREKVQDWRNALKEVANLNGFHLGDRHETELIQTIVKETCKLIPIKLSTHEDLVGINSRLKNLMKLLTSNTNFDDVRMIGIYGMGGIGKTTIARAICDYIYHEFDGVSFLSNVREISKGSTGLVYLQKQLLSQISGETDVSIWDTCYGSNKIRRMLQDKKVLIVIDDVDDEMQLSSLAGNHKWFGLGSRVIITTRDKHLLITHGVDKLYEAEQLNGDEALEFFISKAFKNRQPSTEYLHLSKRVVNYSGGLPLALEVVGSFLFGRSLNDWESAIERMHSDSESGILDRLQISFDGLKEKEKKIFLDIACFFKGANKDYVTKILDGCGFNSCIGISVLIDKCLLNISNDNKLWMHDLLQEMGQQIVRRGSPKEPGKRSRLWEKADILHVLTKNTGTEVVEGIILENEEHLYISAKSFLKMTNLRLLKICNVQLFEDLKYLSSELSLLEWHGCSLKSLPSSLQLFKTIVLQLENSHIEQLWKEIRHLNKLKVINLRHSKMFKKTPDVKDIPNLEELILEGCTKLYEIHPSLLVHKKLKLLNMKDCTSLTTVPSEIAMESLEKLVLSGCLKLKKFPEIVRSMERLTELFLEGTAIKELPLSIEFLTGLTLLSLEDCMNLVSLPCTIYGLKYLKTLKMAGCPELENLPESLGQIESLEELDIRGTATGEPVPKSWYSRFTFNLMSKRSSSPMTLKMPSLSGLISLKKLNLEYRNIEVITSDIDSLASLEFLVLSGNNFVSLPTSVNRLSKLICICLGGCKRLQSVPELPSSVESVIVSNCISLETLSTDAQKPQPFSLISLKNCFKLVNYDGISMIFSALKNKPIIDYEEIQVDIPGSEIPKWFRYQSEGSSIKIKGRGDLKLKGYVICAVYFVHKLPRVRGEPRSLSLRCNIGSRHYWLGENETAGMPDHLWLKYVAVDPIPRSKDWNDFELKFESWNNEPALEVRRCGAHPIYEEELDKLDNLSSSISGKLIEFNQDSVGTTKGNRTDDDVAEDEPQQKRRKIL